jgi:dTDP-4-amino-4,6-dideoxygalactose transaminase
LLKALYLRGEKISKDEFLVLNREAEECLYRNTEMCRISDYAKKRLQSVDIMSVFNTRTDNARFLMEHLKRYNSRINAVLNDNIESPLYFPIYVDDRKELQQYLINYDIYASIIWQISKEVRPVDNENVQYIYEHLLAIPCDQRYSIDDMKKIILCIDNYLNK